jgi:hypothetical protein
MGEAQDNSASRGGATSHDSRGRETGWSRPDPRGVGRPPRGKDADGVRRTRDFGLPNHKKIRPGAEIDEGRRPWEIKGIPPGSEVPK